MKSVDIFTTRRAYVLASALLALLALHAAAQSTSAPELPVTASVRQMVNLPAESPSITLRADDRIDSLNVVLREGGRVVVQRGLGSMQAGAQHVLTWRAEPGEHTYTLEASGKTAAGHAQSRIEVVVTVMRPLEVKLVREQVDLEERTLYFTMNNPAGRARLVIYNAAGRTIHDGTTDLRGRAAGSRLVVNWPGLADPVQKMELRVYDASESWSDFELVPFTVEIPHQDVVFESAKWEIRATELPKLESAYDAILQAIREHGSDIKARLYILGHTDTVGSNADNMLLSRRRAAAIARYFTERGGISLPILAQGFGETQLAVPTADNVDEARNRRAQYILAAQEPVRTDWVVVSAGAEGARR